MSGRRGSAWWTAALVFSLMLTACGGGGGGGGGDNSSAPAAAVELREQPLVLSASNASVVAQVATGYGELQRFIGPELQYGPRSEADNAAEFISIAALPRPRAIGDQGAPEKRAANGGAIEPGSLRRA